MAVRAQHWRSAAVSANTLSEVRLVLGEVYEADRVAEQSGIYADLSGEEVKQMATRTSQADALFCAGHREEAEALFREANLIQSRRQPEYPHLYSIGGFRYSSLRLALAEFAAWQITLNKARHLPAEMDAAVHSSSP